ncbi:SH3 domain-containing protein [Pseudomonas lini]|uniref:SH3 domain-containing protein n=1 Tax=Pseudomonas lini TaxID=163011 RepID=UPI00345ECD50
MTREEGSKQQPADEQLKVLGSLQPLSEATAVLLPTDPTVRNKTDPPVPAFQATEAITPAAEKRYQASELQRVGGSMEKLAWTTVAGQATKALAEKELHPSRNYQTALDAIEKALIPTRQYQATLDAVEKVLAPARKYQAALDAMEKGLAPTRKYQAAMEAVEKVLAPARKYQAALDAMEQVLAPTRKYQAAMEAVEKWLAPVRKYQAEMDAVEKVLAPTRKYQAALAAVEKMLQPSDSLKAMMAVVDMNQSSASLGSILGSYETLQSSPIFNLLVSTNPKKIESLIEQYERAGESSTIFDGLGHAELDIAEARSSSRDVEAEIVQSLQDDSTTQRLTVQAMAFLILFLAALHTFYSEMAKWKDFRESVCDMQQRLQTFESLAQARKVVRNALCNMPAELKNSFRLTKAEGVNLREGPSMKGDVILTLPKFATLEVIDSDNRDWLLVIYKHEGLEIEGWVSRKFVRSASK